MDVKELLEKKGLDYVPSGRDYKVKCLNPEHEDRNPSMRVDSLTGIFNCFVCGFKGNIFTFFEQKANFLQIKRELFKRKISQKMAENIGLELPENAMPFNRDWRNISAETFKHFEAFEHNNPEYIGRVVFPIRSISGKIVGFNGRALGPAEHKYLIHPPRARLPLFPAKPQAVEGKVLLVEGIFDMLNLYDKGLTNVTCGFGTKKITKEKLNLLKIQGITGIDIFFDGDDAGQNAAKEVAGLVEDLELTTRNIFIKDTDPGELTAQKVIKLKEKLYG